MPQRTFGEAVGMDGPDGGDYCGDCFGDKFAECNCCNKIVESDEVRKSDDKLLWCEECHSDRFSSCDDCGCELDREAGDDQYAEIGRRGRTETEGPYCQSCYDERFSMCEMCNCTVRTRDARTVDSNSYCESCYCDNFFFCEGCSEDLSNDDYAENGYCTNCHRRNNGEEFEAKRFRRATDKCDKAGSLRTFGVELETDDCNGYSDLQNEFCFGAKEDGSISGMEFISSVLSGDAGLKECQAFCDEIESRRFAVDSCCGFHLHIGVSDLSVEQRLNVLEAYYYTYKVWASFVSSDRRNNTYCGASEWSPDELNDIETEEEFNTFAGKNERYTWINTNAWAAHSTFEVRLHSGTITGEKVCNWAAAHLRFVDRVSRMKQWDIRALFAEKTDSEVFAALSEVWGDSDLTDFYRRPPKFHSATRSHALLDPQPQGVGAVVPLLNRATERVQNPAIANDSGLGANVDREPIKRKRPAWSRPRGHIKSWGWSIRRP